jgi:hypothetical protein
MKQPSEFALRTDESWRDVVARIAGEQGLAEECLEEFDHLASCMQSLDTAAKMALYEWDCFPINPLPGTAAMTYRELLEGAAKAVGFHYHGARIEPDYENCYVSKTGDTDDWFVWSPLTDDKDALRLAVALRISIAFVGRALIQVSADGRPIVSEYVNIGADPCAVTRLAIVQAAAAMADNPP